MSYNTFAPKPRKSRVPSERIEIPPLNKAKAEFMLEKLAQMDKQYTSSFDEETRMLVEMFFIRTLVDKEGNRIPIASWPSIQDKRRALMLHSWTIAFFVSVLQRPLVIPKIIIYEDEDIDFLNLNKDSFISTNSPMLDALNSWPDKYLPIRTAKGQRAASFTCKKTSGYKLGDEIYSVKDNFFGTVEASLTTPAFLPTKKESSVDKQLARGWDNLHPNLQMDVILGLKYPERFKEHFNSNFDLTTIVIDPREKELAERYLKDHFMTDA